MFYCFSMNMQLLEGETCKCVIWINVINCGALKTTSICIVMCFNQIFGGIYLPSLHQTIHLDVEYMSDSSSKEIF